MNTTPQTWQERICELVDTHTQWRVRCLNLCAAENRMSPAARAMLASDLAQRYGDYNGRDLTARKYCGTRGIVALEETVNALARELFRASHVELRPLSGHTAGNAVMAGLCRPGDTVMELSREGGGHRLATKLATAPLIPLNIQHLPFDDAAFNVDVEQTLQVVRETRPRLVIVGSSNFLFPVPLRALAEGLLDVPDTVLVYDASHVLGLIAGRRFQDPLAEGAHVVIAGTQKSFPGPQGGIVYSNDGGLMRTISEAVYPALLSNHHLARIPSLGMAMAEMLESGGVYADALIRNAKALATALAGQGLIVVGAAMGYTQSHTVLVGTGALDRAKDWGDALDQMDIVANSVALPASLGGTGLRFGVSELTRGGATVADMLEVASVIAAALLQRQAPEAVKARANTIADRFNSLVPLVSAN